jgi:hypothetical protein
VADNGVSTTFRLTQVMVRHRFTAVHAVLFEPATNTISSVLGPFCFLLCW